MTLFQHIQMKIQNTRAIKGAWMQQAALSLLLQRWVAIHREHVPFLVPFVVIIMLKKLEQLPTQWLGQHQLTRLVKLSSLA
jgi:hypothetical protein